MTFLNLLHALIPEIPFSFFAEFFWVRVWVTSGAQESVSVGFGRGRQFSLFGGEGLPEGCIDHPPPSGVEKTRHPWCCD